MEKEGAYQKPSVGSSVFSGVLASLLWAVGPALVSLLLSMQLLRCFSPPSLGVFSFAHWQNLLPYVPYFAISVGVVSLIFWRERTHRQARRSERALQAYADELARTNEQLLRNNQLKDLFFSRASHELKTPLTSIYGQAQLGLRRFERVPEASTEMQMVRFSLEKINEQTHRLQKLIDDLLDVEMMTTGNMKMHLERCDACSLCTTVVEDFYVASDRLILLDLPVTAVFVRADSFRLTQVLVNLLTNAIKYSFADSEIHLRILVQSNHVFFHVSNVGPTIPFDQQESIFEAFYRAPNKEVTRKQGWGLGLAICKDIVTRHGGCIWVESAPELKTTTFFIDLPLA